jgi:predicted membrane channel-forming protein YqfA (hemolysin III family)
MLLRAVDVFDIYVEPFIHSGFRLPNQPYSYYYRSLFSLHNETFSVWIHLLGTFVLIGQVFQHISQLPISSYSTIYCIYIIYNCIGACIMLLCSAQAHLLHSRTLADHLRSFYLDYFGINFYGFTSGIMLHKFSHRQTFSNGNKVCICFYDLSNFDKMEMI